MTTLNTIIEEEKEAQKTNEEIVEEFRAFAGNIQKQNYVIHHGRFPKGELPQEDESICVYCGVNADKLVEYVSTLLTTRDQQRKKEMEEAYEQGYDKAVSDYLEEANNLLTPHPDVQTIQHTDGRPHHFGNPEAVYPPNKNPTNEESKSITPLTDAWLKIEDQQTEFDTKDIRLS